MKCRFLAALPLLFGGCTNVHLYDAQSQSLAQSAQTSFAKADFDAFKAKRRANLDALHQRDIALAEDAARTTRDQAVLAVISKSRDWSLPDKKLDTVDAELGADTAAPPDVSRTHCPAKEGMMNAVCFLQHENAQQQARADLSASADGFRLEWASEPPACAAPISFPDWASGSPPPTDFPKRYVALLKGITGEFLETRRLTYSDYYKKCQSVLAGVDAENRMLQSGDVSKTDSLAGLNKRLSDAQGVFNRDTKAAEDAADVVAKMQETLKAKSPSPPSEGETVESMAKKPADAFKKAMDDLATAGPAVGIGQSAAAKARIDAIDAFITALAAPDNPGGSGATQTVNPSGTLSPELASAVQVLKTIPSLADQIKAVDATLSAPPLSALEIERTRQMALLAQANRTIARARLRVGMIQAAFDDRVEQLRQTCNARLEMGAAGGPKTAGYRDRQYAALDYYQIGVYLGVRSRYLLRANELDLAEQSAADEAEYAIDAYRAVLGTPIDQFVAYENAGLKPADLAKLIADIASAVGVNIIAGKQL